VGFFDGLGDLFTAARDGLNTYAELDELERQRKRVEEADAFNRQYRSGLLEDREQNTRLRDATYGRQLLESGWVPDDAGSYRDEYTGRTYRYDPSITPQGRAAAARDTERQREQAADQALLVRLQSGDRSVIPELLARGVDLPDQLKRDAFGVKREVDPVSQANAALLGEQRRLLIAERLQRQIDDLLDGVGGMIEADTSPLTPQAIKDLFNTIPSLRARGQELGVSEADFMRAAGRMAQGAETRARAALGDAYNRMGESAYHQLGRIRADPTDSTDPTSPGTEDELTEEEKQEIQMAWEAIAKKPEAAAQIRARFKTRTGRDLPSVHHHGHPSGSRPSGSRLPPGVW